MELRSGAIAVLLEQNQQEVLCNLEVKADTIRYKQTEKDSLTSKLGSAGVGGILAKP